MTPLNIYLLASILAFVGAFIFAILSLRFRKESGNASPACGALSLILFFVWFLLTLSAVAASEKEQQQQRSIEKVK